VSSSSPDQSFSIVLLLASSSSLPQNQKDFLFAALAVVLVVDDVTVFKPTNF
jgi:hypothetical protein